jgi:hypothetical protein
MIEVQETIDLFEAIRQMRKLSSEDTPFSLSHSTYNQPEQTSHGMKHIQNCILRTAAKGDDVVNADEKLFYIDLDNKVNRNCWQPLIMYFNGKKCELN